MWRKPPPPARGSETRKQSPKPTRYMRMRMVLESRVLAISVPPMYQVEIHRTAVEVGRTHVRRQTRSRVKVSIVLALSSQSFVLLIVLTQTFLDRITNFAFPI